MDPALHADEVRRAQEGIAQEKKRLVEDPEYAAQEAAKQAARQATVDAALKELELALRTGIDYVPTAAVATPVPPERKIDWCRATRIFSFLAMTTPYVVAFELIDNKIPYDWALAHVALWASGAVIWWMGWLGVTMTH